MLLLGIIGEGYHTWKFGDRFFYTNTDGEVGFSDAEIAEIRKVTMSHVICER